MVSFLKLKKAEMSEVTVAMILVITLLIIGMVIAFSKLNLFKTLLGG